jgi:DNA-binding NarL/FixJ family response regulator
MLERVTTLLQPTFDVVGVAHNGFEMVEEAMRLNPDVIVADISMPRLDGIEAAGRLREMGARAAIVFLTIHEGPEFVEACLATGARGFVVKSHMKADLVPAINAALSGRRFVSSTSHTKP